MRTQYIVAWVRSTTVDQELLSRLALDPFCLMRLRKHFFKRYAQLTAAERKDLADQDIAYRFRWLHDSIRQILIAGQYEHWLHFLETSEADIAEMIEGTLPVGDLIIRRLSALFAMKSNFIRLGQLPKPDLQPNIAMFTATSTVG